MKKIWILIPLLAISLVGCRKTDEAFESGKYNSGNYDDNYYTEWNGVDQVEIGNISTISNPFKLTRKIINDHSEYGFEVHNLIKEEPKFAYGYLSKLYDGRLRCDGLTTRSRVQLSKTGYGTFFPKEYRGSESFAFALRGATTINYPSDSERIRNIKVDVTFKFYVRREGTSIYDRVDMVFNDLTISSDDYGNTTLVEVPIENNMYQLMYGADAMSFEFELKDLSQYAGYDVTDKYQDDPQKEKEHFAIMLYEVLFPGSKWY